MEPDKEKFWALMQEMEPDMTREEFEINWDELTKQLRGTVH